MPPWVHGDGMSLHILLRSPKVPLACGRNFLMLVFGEVLAEEAQCAGKVVFHGFFGQHKR